MPNKKKRGIKNKYSPQSLPAQGILQKRPPGSLQIQIVIFHFIQPFRLGCRAAQY